MGFFFWCGFLGAAAWGSGSQREDGNGASADKRAGLGRQLDSAWADLHCAGMLLGNARIICPVLRCKQQRPSSGIRLNPGWDVAAMLEFVIVHTNVELVYRMKSPVSHSNG